MSEFMIKMIEQKKSFFEIISNNFLFFRNFENVLAIRHNFEPKFSNGGAPDAGATQKYQAGVARKELRIQKTL